MAGKRAVCSDAHTGRRCVAICEPCYEVQMAAARLDALLKYADLQDTRAVTSEQQEMLDAAQKAVDDGGQL